MANEIRKSDAILSLAPTAQFIVDGDVVTWLDDSVTEPTSAAIDTELARLQAEYDSQEYARDRATAYPPIGDQLDMIYHAGLGGDAFQAAISAVKQEYPK